MAEAPYRIVPTRVFLKDLRKLERNYEVHRRVVAAIERIAQNPHAGIRVRHKETGGWRWWVGAGLKPAPTAFATTLRTKMWCCTAYGTGERSIAWSDARHATRNTHHETCAMCCVFSERGVEG